MIFVQEKIMINQFSYFVFVGIFNLSENSNESLSLLSILA